MDLIYQREDIQCHVDKSFDIQYLSPILSYVQWKIEERQWDDYNEFFHAVQFIETLKQQEDIWLDTQLLRKDGKQIGIMFIVGGKIQWLEKKFTIQNEAESLLLKYFHIAEKGKGYGSLWLKSCIFPHYKNRHYHQIYVSSSHPVSFPFYSRLGREIATYAHDSDNQLYKRAGKCFLIDI